MPRKPPSTPDGLGDNRHIAPAISQALDAAIARLGATQNGNVARRQLLELGVTDEAIRHRLRTGRLFRAYPGVYSVGRPALTPLERAGAAVLACGPGAALSHSSAMVPWSFWRHWEPPIEVTVVRDRRPKGIRVHRSTTLPRREITTQLGVRVTTPARTIFDMSPRVNDKRLRRTVDNALNSIWMTEDQLAEVLSWHPHAPATTRLAKLIGVAGTPTRSDWEGDFPAFCARYGLPTPVMGVPMFGYIADALFVAERVIAELDSKEFHMGAIPFESDRDRDAEMLAHRYVTVRMTWERIEERPQREARRLHKILANQRALHAPSAA